MGFEEAANSSLKNNRRLKKNLRKSFKVTYNANKLSKESFKALSKEEKLALQKRMEIANRNRKRKLRIEYFLILVYNIVGLLFLRLIFY